MTLGILMGLGGGLLRDFLLNVPVVALHDEAYIPVASGAAILGMPLARRITGHRIIGLLLDALTLGLFVMVGTAKATMLGYSTAVSIMIGLVAAIGGGAIVSALLSERSTILLPGPWFATAAFAGAVVFVVAYPYLATDLVEIATVAVTAVLRFTSEYFGYSAPGVDNVSRVFKKTN